MSSVKIQVIIQDYVTKVLVDNKVAYYSRNERDVEESNLKKLVELLQIDNTEVVNRIKV